MQKIICWIIVLEHELGPCPAGVKIRQGSESSSMITQPSCFAVIYLQARLTRRVTLWLCCTPMLFFGLSCNSMFLRVTSADRFRAVTGVSVSEISFVLEILGLVSRMTVHVVERAALQSQVPISSPDRDADSALAITAMTHRTAIDGVYYSSLRSMTRISALFQRCRSVDSPLCQGSFISQEICINS
jgi:hypothetical protein